MLELFSVFRKENLCQLYIYPTLPDIDRCASYFRVTDKEVLKSYLHFGKVKGRTIKKEQIREDNNSMFEHQEDEGLYRNRKNKKPSRMLLRELMWKFSRWYNAALRQWLREQAPEAIFVAPGTGIFLYRMALRIAKERNIPILTYLCDDYYFLSKQKSLLKCLHTAWLRRDTRKLLTHSKHIVSICEELKERFAQEFSVPATTIMTGTSRAIKSFPLKRPEPKAITYMGNVRCNRYISLIQIGEALAELNQRQGTEYKLKIYTGEKNPEILQALGDVPTVELCGFVTGTEFEAVLSEAQLLLHTEAFDEQSIDLVKDSVSTKIADCLGSGICLIAYGPDSVASIRHLQGGRALCATRQEDLRNVLQIAFTDEQARKDAVGKALEAARKYHDSKINSQQLRDVMERL